VSEGKVMPLLTLPETGAELAAIGAAGEDRS
jgi:hypothetical protein